jgi:hypothetical protein
MAHDVFISYSNVDKLVADSICVNLEAAGVRCWIAPRDIAPGEDWPAAITNAISQSRVMVLVFSTYSNSSEDVSRELFLAANSKLVIIPFKIENIEPEPGKQYYLARTHWLDAINPPTQEQIHELLDCVKLLIPVRKTTQVIEGQSSTTSNSDQGIPGNEPDQRALTGTGTPKNEYLPAKKPIARFPEPQLPASAVVTPGTKVESTARVSLSEDKKQPKKPGNRTLAWSLWVLVVLIALSCVWFGLSKMTSLGQIFRPSISPIATITLTSTMSPTGTGTPTVSNPPTPSAPFGNVYISDAFNDNSNGWLLGNVNGTSWTGTRLIANGVLDWEGISRGMMFSEQFPGKSNLQDKISNMQVSSKVKQLNPAMNGFYGVSIRGTGENNLMSFYAFVVDQSGNSAFLLYTDSNWKNLSDWKKNNYVNNGDWNKMTIQAVGSHFSLFMNNNLLSEIDDGTLPVGQGGIIVSVSTSGELIKIQFDDFEVRLPSP